LGILVEQGKLATLATVETHDQVGTPLENSGTPWG